MAVALGNAAVPIVDTQFRFLVAAHPSTPADCLALGVVVTGGTVRATALDVLAGVRIRHHMMRVCSMMSPHTLTILLAH